ncbi:MAG: cysteine desulfurase family protein [Chitinophagaceae bacterium]
MLSIYFDNAATTALDPQVFEDMQPYFETHYGNASSIHALGRKARTAIENARNNVSSLLHCRPGELFFTGSGTESTNTVLQSAVRDLGCKHIITSPIEHHATLHTVVFLHSIGACTYEFVKLNAQGHIDYSDLEEKLKASTQKTLVTLMHANNEIGNITDVARVAHLCQLHGALFHSDMVQSIAHEPIDLEKMQVDFVSGSGHKFHGPKGTGILFIRQGLAIKSLLHGGGQERNQRAGTENTAGIVGFASALEKAYKHLDTDMKHIGFLNKTLEHTLMTQIQHVVLHGDSGKNRLKTILNMGFALNNKTELLSIQLDMAGICVSGGSACTSGAQGGSHVIKALYGDCDRVPIRFSFCKYNTEEEVKAVANKIVEILQ